jgi:hypothetical protein
VNDPDDDQPRQDALQRSLDEPMPADLAAQVSALIEPQTMNAGLPHDEVLICIDIAFPVIRDYLRGQRRMSDQEKAQARDTAVAAFSRVVPLVNGQAIRAAWRLWDAGAAWLAQPAASGGYHATGTDLSRAPDTPSFPRVELPPFEPLQPEDLLAGPQIYSSALLRAERDSAYRVINALVRRYAGGEAYLPDGSVEAEQPVVRVERRDTAGAFVITVLEHGT